MTETNSNNALIAEFMDIPKCGRCEDCGAYQYSASVIYQPEDMKYNTSWDWLMPVVDKIEALAAVTIISKGCKIETIDEEFIKSGLTTHNAVYQAVVQFINWYNTNPLQQK